VAKNLDEKWLEITINLKRLWCSCNFGFW